MKFLFVLTLSLLCSAAVWAQLEASSKNCDLYSKLENEMRCGPQAYFQKWGQPMCEKYIRSEEAPIQSLFLSHELKVWFPQVRLCLQQYLVRELDALTCQNLDQHAKQSHVECYVQTGYCDLSAVAKLQLAGMSANAFFLDPVLWQQSALEISEVCAGLDYQR